MGTLILNDDVTQKLATLIRNGVSLNGAANALELNARVVYEWIEKGDNGDGPEPYGTLAREVMRALGTLELEAVQVLMKAVKGQDVKSAQYVLERRFRRDWGPPKDDTPAAGPATTVIQIQWPGHAAREAFNAELEQPIADAEVVDEPHD